MRKNETRPHIQRLRKGTSDGEIICWIQTYDVFERLNAGVSEIGIYQTDLQRLLEEALGQE